MIWLKYARKAEKEIYFFSYNLNVFSKILCHNMHYAHQQVNRGTMMSIATYWDDPGKTILIFAFNETWTVDDYLQTSRYAQKLMNSVAHPVALIAVFSEGIHLPTGFFQSLYKTQKMITVNLLGVALVADSAFARSTYKLLSTVVPSTMQLVKLVSDVDTARVVAYDWVDQADRQYPAV